MAIKGNFNFRPGVPVKNGYVCIARIFGGSREGWNAIVEVYAAPPVVTNVPAVMAEDGTTVVTPARVDVDRGEALETFNISAPFIDGQNPYNAIYSRLKNRPRYTAMVDDIVATIPKE